MDSSDLHIFPVYSEEYSGPDKQIGSINLLKHQIKTFKAFQDPQIEVIFNVAMTGDGKSLAAYLPALLLQERILAMYPTNELIQDQHKALSKYKKSLNLLLPTNDIMHSKKITSLMNEHNEEKRFEEVRKLLVRNDILLTNPDLVHLMLTHQYGWEHQRKELAVTTGASFDYFLFDEFHVFGVPQVLSVMNMLGYLLANYRDKPAERKKFIFLSATPNRLLNNLLQRGGIRYKVIEGSYASSKRDHYRCILQPCTLQLHEVNQDAPVEIWVKEHVEEIRSFFQKHPGSKAAILVYSVATARRLVTFLKDYFQPYGIEVGENTGLTSWEERRTSYDKHILVGTTTVDVGVDFHINYLIFEASSAGSFLQRFGRLGRHAGFETYQAHALIPRFVLERLKEKFVPGREMERETFNAAIREAFPGEQEFANYTQRWGIMQAAQVLVALQGQEKLDANQAFKEALQEQYERFYGIEGKSIMEKALKKYWALNMPGHAPEIIAELQSFRGQSPLSCGVWDTNNDLKTYDLFFLLANASIEVITKETFLEEVEKRGLDQREFRDKFLYLRVWEYIAERQSLTLGLRNNLTENAHILHQAIVQNDFFVREPRLDCLAQVNPALKKLKLPCLISYMPRNELWQRLKLGGIFPIYRLRDGWGQEYSVAFGEEALLLESLLFFQKSKGGGYMML